MKKILILLAFATLLRAEGNLQQHYVEKALSLTQTQMAPEPVSTPGPIIHATDFNHRKRFYLGPQGFYMRLATGSLNTFKGSLWGAVAGYDQRDVWGLFANINGFYALGYVKGDRVQKRFVHDEEVEGRFGGCIPLSKSHNWVLTPFIGYGFIHTIQSLTRPNLPSLKFKYYKYTLPLGFLLSWTAQPWLNVELDFRWLPQLDPTVKVDELSGGRWELKHQNGYSVHLPISLKMVRQGSIYWDLSLVPFWRYIKDGDTFAVTSAGTKLAIPENSYTYWGASLNLGLNF